MAEEKKNNTAPATSKVAVKKTSEKLGFFKRIGKWFRDMKSELKKVVWPTRKQTAKNTGIAVVMIVVCAIVLWGFDSAAQALVKALINIFA
ncbi:MAG: preprotein translocase subunit SecE [Oscillospiraceae bacterium]|nr:preprotein translocase subunit SecE [Oscillospiraceae bacterium]